MAIICEDLLLDTGDLAKYGGVIPRPYTERARKMVLCDRCNVTKIFLDDKAERQLCSTCKANMRKFGERLVSDEYVDYKTCMARVHELRTIDGAQWLEVYKECGSRYSSALSLKQAYLHWRKKQKNH